MSNYIKFITRIKGLVTLKLESPANMNTTNSVNRLVGRVGMGILLLCLGFFIKEVMPGINHLTDAYCKVKRCEGIQGVEVIK